MRYAYLAGHRLTKNHQTPKERLRAVMTKACDLRWPLPRSTGHSHVQLWRDAGVCRRGRLVKPSHAAGSLGRCMLADAAGYSIKRSSAGRIDRSCAALYAAGKGSRRSTSTRRGNFTRACSSTAMLVAARRCWLRHDDVCNVPHDGAPTVSRLSPMLVNPCPRLLAVRTARAAAALSFRHAARLLQIHRQLALSMCLACRAAFPSHILRAREAAVLVRCGAAADRGRGHRAGAATSREFLHALVASCNHKRPRSIRLIEPVPLVCGTS